MSEPQKPSDKPTPPKTYPSGRDVDSPQAIKAFHERSALRAQEIVDNLHRNVMAEHEADLADLPPEIRASKTEAEWLTTPPLEILKLARDAKTARFADK